MVSKRTPPHKSAASIEDELEYLYLRHMLVVNLIKALEIYVMVSSDAGSDGDSGHSRA